MHVAKVSLRWSDMDALGHVNNSEYLTYLEQARIEFLSDAAAAGVPRETAGLLVARNEIDYLKPLPYRRDPIDVVMWVDRIGSSSFTFAYEVRAEGAVHARARTVVVCIGEDSRPTPVPVAFRRYLDQHTEKPAG